MNSKIAASAFLLIAFVITFIRAEVWRTKALDLTAIARESQLIASKSQKVSEESQKIAEEWRDKFLDCQQWAITGTNFPAGTPLVIRLNGGPTNFTIINDGRGEWWEMARFTEQP